MKKFFVSLITVIIFFGLFFWWLEWMLFPPKPKPPAGNSAPAVVKKLEKKNKGKEIKKQKKKVKKNKKNKKIRPQESRPRKESVKGTTFPWHKLQDEDIILVLAATGLLAFAAGVSYFQLYWKRKLPDPRL